MLKTEGKLKKSIFIRPVVTGTDIRKFGDLIHAALSGNVDYINSNIVLHLNGYNENPDHRVDDIELHVFEECKFYPPILSALEFTKELTTNEGVEIFIEVVDLDDLEVDETFSIEEEFKKINSNLVSPMSQALDIIVIEPRERGSDISEYAEHFYNTFKPFIDNKEMDAFYLDDINMIRVFLYSSLHYHELKFTVTNFGRLVFNGIEMYSQYFNNFTEYDKYVHYITDSKVPEEAKYDSETNRIKITHPAQLDKYYHMETRSYVFTHDGKLANVEFDLDVMSLMGYTIVAKNIYSNWEVSADTIICDSIKAHCIVCKTIIAKHFVELSAKVPAEECFKYDLSIIEGSVTL